MVRGFISSPRPLTGLTSTMAELTASNKCHQCNNPFGFLFGRSAQCPACAQPTCTNCLVNKISHPSFPTRRVETCKNCYEQALLARDGQHFETVPGPVSNRIMLFLANFITKPAMEMNPSKPIVIKRDALIWKMLPMASPATIDGIQSEDIDSRADDGTIIKIRWFHPAPLDRSKKYPAAIYFHGGGWCAGTVFQKDQDQNFRIVSKALGMMFFAVEYRLAPENPFPIPFEDCYAAYKHVIENADQLCVDTSKVITTGDSAGGNLSATVAIAAIERGITPPSYIVSTNSLMSPDKYNQFPSWNALHEHAPREAIDGMVLAYLPNPDDRKDWRASPGYARKETLARLPPNLVMIAGYDALRDENMDWVNTLKDAGVKVTSTVFSTSWHGFFPRFAEGQEALSQMALIIKRHFGLPM